MAKPFNLNKWIDENRHLLQPPVGTKFVQESGDYIVMLVAAGQMPVKTTITTKQKNCFIS
jgi:hypothetical protein